MAASQQTTKPVDAKQTFSKNSDFPFTSFTQTDIGPLQHPSPNKTISPPNTLRERKTAMFKRHSGHSMLWSQSMWTKITPFSLHNSTVRSPILHGTKLRCKTQDHPKICTLYVEVRARPMFSYPLGRAGCNHWVKMFINCKTFKSRLNVKIKLATIVFKVHFT